MIEKAGKIEQADPKAVSDGDSPESAASLPPAQASSGGRRWLFWGISLVVLVGAILLAPLHGAFFPLFEAGDQASSVTQVDVRPLAGAQIDKHRLAHETDSSSAATSLATKRAEGPSSVAIDGAPGDAEMPMGDEEADEKTTQTPAVLAAAQETNRVLAKNRNDMKALEAAVESLDHRLKALEDTLAQEQGHGRQTLAGLAALVPLEMEALSGRPFTGSYAAMQDVAMADPKLAGLVAPLESLAAKGAPSPEVLARRFEKKERAARLALARAEAKTWLDRMRVALRSVIDIRRTDDQGEEAPWEAIHEALADGRLADAAGAIDKLPEAARTLLAPLAEAAKARAAMEDSLRDISLYLSSQVRGN